MALSTKYTLSSSSVVQWTSQHMSGTFVLIDQITVTRYWAFRLNSTTIIKTWHFISSTVSHILTSYLWQSGSFASFFSKYCLQSTNSDTADPSTLKKTSIKVDTVIQLFVILKDRTNEIFMRLSSPASHSKPISIFCNQHVFISQCWPIECLCSHTVYH